MSLSSGLNFANIKMVASQTYLIFLLMKNGFRPELDPVSTPELLAPLPPVGRTTSSSKICKIISLPDASERYSSSMIFPWPQGQAERQARVLAEDLGIVMDLHG